MAGARGVIGGKAGRVVNPVCKEGGDDFDAAAVLCFQLRGLVQLAIQKGAQGLAIGFSGVAEGGKARACGADVSERANSVGSNTTG